MKDFKDTAQREPSSSRWMRLRVALVGVAFVAALGGALSRAVYLQIFDSQRMLSMAQDQYLREVEIPARRGDIFDRRGTPLAQSVEVDSIWIDPSEQEDLPRTSKLLAKALSLDGNELLRRMGKARRFAWIKRKVRPDEVAKVKALNLRGIGFTREPRRFYPQKELAAHVLGMVGTDGHGLDGLELAFEDELSGEKSQQAGYRDARGRKLLVDGLVDPLGQQGAAITLTIDRHLQYLAEKALGQAVTDSKAHAGKVVVLDPATGEILALANHPRFNPNAPTANGRDFLRNRAALDAFEPGSTTKPMVVAAALESGAIKATDIFFCENGSFDIGRNTIHDTKPHGWLGPGKILQVSSNIGMTKIATELGRERLVDYHQRFGFGEKVGLALPGEGRGSVPFPRADVSLATQSFGQGLSMTAVQLAAAYGALANDGVLMRPFLVSKVVDPDAVVLLENKPTEVRRVVSARTARQVVSMLEGVATPEGTAPRARLDGYPVAGKTGTAQKADPVARGYSDKRIASFAGIVPADDPRLVILVVIDEPKTDVYGGLVAAPAFREIAEGAMTYLGVPPRGPVKQPVAAAEVSRTGGAASERVALDAQVGADATIADAITEKFEPGAVAVPDVRGKVGRDAISLLLGAALEPRLMGSGRVVSQTPVAGARVQKGAKVTIQLAARP